MSKAKANSNIFRRVKLVCARLFSVAKFVGRSTITLNYTGLVWAMNYFVFSFYQAPIKCQYRSIYIKFVPAVNNLTYLAANFPFVLAKVLYLIKTFSHFKHSPLLTFNTMLPLVVWDFWEFEASLY